jgi:hypothetical protein
MRRRKQLVVWWDMDPWDSNECKSHSKHKWIHFPQESYGGSFDRFCDGFDPLLPLALTKQDFGSTTRVKHKNAAVIREASWLTTRPRSLIAADSFEPFVFWGMKNQLVPIVIDTGASILVTGIKSDFIGEIHKVDPGASLQGLNNEVKVHGAGTVRWTIRDQYDRVGTIQTSAYYVPDAQVRLLSPQTYFIECERGKLIVTRDTNALLKSMMDHC